MNRMMMRFASFFAILVCVTTFSGEVYAQSADGSSTADPTLSAGDSALSTDGTTSPTSSTAPTKASDGTSLVPPSRPDALAPTPASGGVAPTPRVTTSSTTTSVMSPSGTSVTPTITMPPAPPPPPSSSEMDVAPVLSVLSAAPESPISAVLLGAGVALLFFFGGLFLQKARKKKAKNMDPCGVLKQELEGERLLYEEAKKKLSLDEVLVASLKAKLDDLRGEVTEEMKKEVQEMVHEAKSKLLAKEVIGKLKEVVTVAEDAKELYDELVVTHEKATKLVEALRNIVAGHGEAVHMRELAYRVCTEGVSHSRSPKGSGAIIPHEASLGKKTILVDAIHTFVFEEEGIFQPMHKLLEEYHGRKIILTGANDEQFMQFGLSAMPYEVFTLKHHPDKSDPAYYKKMLKHFGLAKGDVIYIEHNLEAVKSARSLGIQTYHYDKDKKDLVALKKFLDENF